MKQPLSFSSQEPQPCIHKVSHIETRDDIILESHDLTVFFNAGQDYEIFRLLHLGEKCTAQTRPADIYEKQGARGRFVVIASRTDYATLSGEPVMRAHQYSVHMAKGSVPDQQ